MSYGGEADKDKMQLPELNWYLFLPFLSKLSVNDGRKRLVASKTSCRVVILSF
jgi:hypothetical protein